jgi:hypothetical protein
LIRPGLESLNYHTRADQSNHYTTDAAWWIQYLGYIQRKQQHTKRTNHIGGVMVSMFASSAVDHGFEPRSGQTKDYKIGICCFSAKHAALRRKSKDWFARNRNNVSKWSDISTRGLLFQWASTIKIQLSVVV